MNNESNHYIFLLIMLIVCLSACNDKTYQHNDKNKSKVDSFQCIRQQSQCFFDIADGQAKVQFNVDKIIVEQEFTLAINYSGDKTLASISGYLEGVEMYMGKIPIFLRLIQAKEGNHNQVSDDKMLSESDTEIIHEERLQIFQGQVQVGSCSAEKMTWRMWLTFTTSDNQTHHKMLTIISNRI